MHLPHDLTDKYALSDLPDVDCGPRLHLCRARCCHFSVRLTLQDMVEGIVSRDRATNTLVRRPDGSCVHLDGGRCTVYEHRPAVCRRYDCRGDDRVWADFEAMISSGPLTSPKSP